MIHLDTHVVVWLHAGALDQLPAKVRRRIEAEELVVSPVVELEITFLKETGRITEGGSAVLDELARRIGLKRSKADMRAVVAAAGSLSWTRDPFDRLIVGQAIADDVALLTRDRTIRRNYARASWG